MVKKTERKDSGHHTPDHLANERTFLAWIRTCIGIMAFGFVVEKFAIFIKQTSLFFGKHADSVKGSTLHPEHSSIFGLFLIILGILISLLSFIKYKQIEKQIEEDTYHSSSMLAIVCTITVVVIGSFLVVYLTKS